LQNLTASVGEV